jgi:deoxycytidine triphosphate deaminase
MVFSDLQIKDALLAGQIVITPLIEDNIRGSSVDVTLGEWYYTTGGDSRDIYNLRRREARHDS